MCRYPSRFPLGRWRSHRKPLRRCFVHRSRDLESCHPEISQSVSVKLIRARREERADRQCYLGRRSHSDRVRASPDLLAPRCELLARRLLRSAGLISSVSQSRWRAPVVAMIAPLCALPQRSCAQLDTAPPAKPTARSPSTSQRALAHCFILLGLGSSAIRFSSRSFVSMPWSSSLNFDARTLQMTAAERDSARLGNAELSTAPKRP